MEINPERNPKAKNIEDGGIAAAIAVSLTLALRKGISGPGVQIRHGESQWMDSARCDIKSWDGPTGWERSGWKK